MSVTALVRVGAVAIYVVIFGVVVRSNFLLISLPVINKRLDTT